MTQTGYEHITLEYGDDIEMETNADGDLLLSIPGEVATLTADDVEMLIAKLVKRLRRMTT